MKSSRKPMNSPERHSPFDFVHYMRVLFDVYDDLDLLPARYRLRKRGLAESDMYAAVNTLYNTLKDDRKEGDPRFIPLIVPKLNGGLDLVGASDKSLVARLDQSREKPARNGRGPIGNYSVDELNNVYVANSAEMSTGIKIGSLACDIVAIADSDGDHETEKGLHFTGATQPRQRSRIWEEQSMYGISHERTVMGVCSPAAYVIAQAVKLKSGDMPLDAMGTATVFPQFEARTVVNEHVPLLPTMHYIDGTVGFGAVQPSNRHEDIGARLLVAERR